MTKKGRLWRGIWLACAAACIAPACASAAGLFYPCYRAATPPKIDGVLDDKDWTSAERIDLLDLVTGAKPGLASSARMMWDNACLYVAFEFADSNTWARIKTCDAPAAPDFKGYTENFAKLYLDPDGDGRNYTEMHFTPSGAVNDKWQSAPWQGEAREAANIPIGENPAAHWDWNCEGMLSAVAIQGTVNQSNDVDQGWTVEIAIPFSAMKQFAGRGPCPPAADDTWRVHLGRRFQLEGDNSSNACYWTWPALGLPDCHNPDRWGYVVFVNNVHPQIPDSFTALPKANFAWKMLWVRPEQTRTPEAVEKTVDDAARLRFTAIAAEPSTGLVAAVHGKGMKFFAWMLNLRGGAGVKEYLKTRPDHAQQLGPMDRLLIGMPRISADRLNINTGEWLCPDRGLLDVELRQIEEFLVKLKVDGIALDYVGYRNYYACFCPHSEKERGKYAKAHPELAAGQVLWKYSEASLAKYVQQVRDAANAVKPGAELAIHVYPDFDPNPMYAACLPVTYCGQTVAWFYEPFWPYSAVAGLTLRHKAAQTRFKTNRFVPFVGAYSRFPKNPDRLRTEIRIAGLAGNGSIMIAFYETFLENPALAQVLADEL